MGSRITIPSDAWGGALEEASLGTLGGGSPTRCFFLAQPEGAEGVRSLPGGY